MSNFNQDALSYQSNLKTSSRLSAFIKEKNKSSTLFSEIMKNHNKTPDISLPDSKKEENSIVVDFLDIPLPDNGLRSNSKLKNVRKRHKTVKEEPTKRIRSSAESETTSFVSTKNLPLPNIINKETHAKIERKEKETTFKYPKISLSRTRNRYGSTWGERSVKSFKVIAEVGEGTYGHVFKAIDRRSGAIKALKKIRLENEKEGFPITTVREIKILQQLNHSNIVQLNEVVTDYDLKSGMNIDKGFYLVFEYMDHDLYGILDSGVILSDLQVASIMKQIIDGLCYCHKRMFLHRDIKCSNILVNNKGEVKIADFGLARRFYADNIKRPYTNKVITLWYRAPELLLGEEIYGVAIDVWSIGCIMGELFTRRTMFTATNEMEQLEAIAKVCGTPNTGVWPDVAKLPLYQTFRTKYNYKRRLREYYCTLPNSALEVLDWMLQLDPKRRCTAEQALNSFWLRKIDPKQIPPPDFPTDKDYHELSCKRRHKQNHSDTGYKSSKSSIKPQQSSSSSNSDGVNLHSSTVDSYQPGGGKSSSFELPDDVMAELKEKLGSIIPNSDGIEDLINTASLSLNGIEGKLEELLEPYIKDIIKNKLLTSQSNFLCKSVHYNRDNETIDGSKSQLNFITQDPNIPCHPISPTNQSKNSCKYV